MQFIRTSGPAAVVVGLSAVVAGCSEAPQSIEPMASEPLAAEQEIAVVAPSISPALSREITEEPSFEIANGTRLDFTGNLTTEQQALVEEHLTEARANSGGPAADVRAASVDLNDDGRDDAIVMIHSGPYCGSGNVCNFWMFEREASGWRRINGDDDAANALYLLPGSTYGYRDIGIQGQCGTETCDFLLAYDGRNYQWVNDPTPGPAG